MSAAQVPLFDPADGPVRLDRFMARANATYYATRNPFDDFITAPEISQIFGELIGAWAAAVWQGMGAPPRVMLAEAGPGRGTLMADALRLVARVLPSFHAALDVHLIETSAALREVQAQALSGAALRPVTWHDRVENLPTEVPLILLGNEFLDALPIRQFVRRGAGWLERAVDGLTFTEQALIAPLPVEPFQRAVPEGEVLEVCEPALSLAAHLGARFSTQPGVALMIDYGFDSPSWGESLQALFEGQPAWPLDRPGAADLTAHVDFRAFGFAARAAGAAVQGAVTQAEFLGALGLFARLTRLAQGVAPAQVAALRDGAMRLVAPEQMGRLFKVMALRAPGVAPLPGFAQPSPSGS